jgi:hypothetical protein
VALNDSRSRFVPSSSPHSRMVIVSMLAMPPPSDNAPQTTSTAIRVAETKPTSMLFIDLYLTCRPK